MKPFYLLIPVLLTATSCGYFETEKISTETFYEEELKMIDWSEVDQYPLFSACEHIAEKEAQKSCFIKTLSDLLYEAANNTISSTYVSINSTVFIEFSVTEKAELLISSIEMDSTVTGSFPLLKDALRSRIDSLNLVAPAYKRGIPVRTEFTFPIDIVTEEL